VNIRNLAIVAAVVVVLISLVAFVFFQTLMKENAPVPAAISADAVVKEDVEMSYSIPDNIPPLSLIEESMKKNQEKSKQVDQDVAKLVAENDKVRQSVRIEAEAADQEAIAASKEVKIGITSTAPKAVRFSTDEQVQQKVKTKAKGLLAF